MSRQTVGRPSYTAHAPSSRQGQGSAAERVAERVEPRFAKGPDVVRRFPVRGQRPLARRRRARSRHDGLAPSCRQFVDGFTEEEDVGDRNVEGAVAAGGAADAGRA